MRNTLDKVADELAIRNLIARLAHLADDGELEYYIECFAEDIEWGGGGQPLRQGRTAVLEGARQRRADGITGPGSGSRHVVTTSWVTVHGETASAASIFHFYMHTDTQSPALVSLGVYRDEFCRRSAEWKLVKRTLQGNAATVARSDS